MDGFNTKSLDIGFIGATGQAKEKTTYRASQKKLLPNVLQNKSAFKEVRYYYSYFAVISGSIWLF